MHSLQIIEMNLVDSIDQSAASLRLIAGTQLADQSLVCKKPLLIRFAVFTRTLLRTFPQSAKQRQPLLVLRVTLERSLLIKDHPVPVHPDNDPIQEPRKHVWFTLGNRDLESIGKDSDNFGVTDPRMLPELFAELFQIGCPKSLFTALMKRVD
jgi:hypothetical protein